MTTKRIKTYLGIIEIKHPFKILSVNSLYKPASTVGKGFAWLYKDKQIENLQDEIVRLAEQTELSLIKNEISNVVSVDVDYIFLLDKNIEKRDTTNMVKCTEDALMRITKIDDSKHIKISSRKALSYIPSTEYIVCAYKVKYDDDENKQ